MYRIFINDESVPAEEYVGLVRLLQDNNIEWTERPRLIGSLFRFGTTGAGADLMVATEHEQQRARALIDAWQADLIAASRQTYDANREKNRLREVIGWIIAALVIGGVLWLSLTLGNW